MAFTWTLAWLLLAPCTPPGDAIHINQRNFKIPIQIDAARRAEFKELILYSSSNQGQTWEQAAAATPDKEAFSFYAPGDGLYWFSVGIVDQQGRRTPENIFNLAPAQKIRVDTAKPLIRIVSATRQGDEIAVNWEIQEEHADLNSLKLEHRAAGAPEMTIWYPATITPALTGQARFRPNQAGGVSVRLQMQDQAGNTGAAQTDVGSPALAAAPMENPLGSGSPSFGNPSLGNSGNPNPFSTASGNPLERPPAYNASLVRGGSPPGSDRPITPGMNAGPENGNRLLAVSTPAAQPAAPVPGGVRMARGALPPLQVVNDPQVSLEYEVTQFGLSGVGKVELWVTPDDGRTWQYLADDPDLKSPITATLPREGLYGFRLVIQSGAGLTEGPPLAGDLPEVRIEVDTTPPVVQLFEPSPDPGRRDTLTISWNATDRNLTPKPITLEWAERREGPWHVIAGDLPNTGSFNWQLPASMQFRVFLRATARDTASNRGVATSPEPLLIDLNKPRGVLKGLSNGLRPQ